MIRPLTKCKKDGTLYARPAIVERQAAQALTLDPKTLVERGYVNDNADPQYLSCECLVLLIRHANVEKNEGLRNQLLTPLLIRCERLLQAKIPDGSCRNAADLREELLGRFSELIALDGSHEDEFALDYYECRFNSAFKKLRLTLLQKEHRRNKGRVELPPNAEEESVVLDEKGMARFSQVLSTPATQEDSVFRQELWAAIEALPEDERRAVTLHFMLGYKTESVDPNEATVATICGVTGKTIRNRLARALPTLAKVFEEVI